MGVKFYRMFGGEHRGDLALLHIGFRAQEVRASIAKLYADHDYPYSAEARSAAWRRAVRDGWRVVPLSITKYTGGKRRVPPAPRKKTVREFMRSCEPTAAECARNRAWDQVG